MLKEWIDRADNDQLSEVSQIRSLVSDIHDTLEQTEESIPVLLSCTSDIDDTETVNIENPLLVPHESMGNIQTNSDLNDGQKQDLECIF